jgi:hypothetical protein
MEMEGEISILILISNQANGSTVAKYLIVSSYYYEVILDRLLKEAYLKQFPL